MKQISILIETKNTDLHAMSAFEALKAKPSLSSLKQLKRYRHVVLSFNVDGDIEGILTQFINSSYILLNTNKEQYDFKSPAKPAGNHVMVEVSNNETSDVFSKNVLDRINETVEAVQFLTLKESIVWEFIFDSNSADINSLNQLVMDDCVRAESYTGGLLMNPIYEDAQLI